MEDEGYEEGELNVEKKRELTNFRSGIRTFDFKKRTYVLTVLGREESELREGEREITFFFFY